MKTNEEKILASGLHKTMQLYPSTDFEAANPIVTLKECLKKKL